MDRLTQHDAMWWIKKHLKGTEITIYCQQCKQHGVKYDHLGRADRACVYLHKNLNYWPYSNAPGWCPRRKKNGGTI